MLIIKLKEISKKLSGVDGALSLPKNSSSLDRFRFEIQQEFVKYKQEDGLSGFELAELLDVAKTAVSKILRHRLSEFSTDRILRLLSKIKPETEYKLLTR